MNNKLRYIKVPIGEYDYEIPFKEVAEHMANYYASFSIDEDSNLNYYDSVYETFMEISETEPEENLIWWATHKMDIRYLCSRFNINKYYRNSILIVHDYIESS